VLKKIKMNLPYLPYFILNAIGTFFSQACLGTNTWVANALASDVDFKKEVLDKDGIKEFSDVWRTRLEADMLEITFKRLASAETNRTPSLEEASNSKASLVSADGEGTRPSSQVDAAA